ncbi:MAG: TetR/AcrR family transcriptional regulator [Actinoplanes sp.]
MSSRKYEQRLRAEAAEDTKRRIVDAVLERMRTAPAEQVSVDRVAKMAGVARSTVYLIFGSRAGLFDAVGEDLMRRGGFDRIMRALEHPDALQSVCQAIRANVEMLAAHRDELRVLHSMAQLDPAAVGGVLQRLDDGQAQGMDYHARRLAEQGFLPAGMAAAEAANVLWVLTSFDTFDVLYTGRRLPAAEVAAMLVVIAERTFRQEQRS